ncbi:unnamed protein product [Pleuronectes platessa]|uniref:Uncharacterized protein n=1 Tax=Pleuronectes platessa TaxID=8262 RepID=A0A9N7Z136_PLEPL|nr:unnamed protein product [Pleuronectes platessa]
MFPYGKKHTAPHYKHVLLVVRLIIDGWDTDKTPGAIFVREGYCIVRVPVACTNPCRISAWSLPSFSQQQLNLQIRPSQVLLTDGGPPHLSQVAAINFEQGHREEDQVSGV